MAYPTVDKPYGLKPVNLIGGQVFAGATRQMEIASGYATGIFYGDLVKRVTGGTIEKRRRNRHSNTVWRVFGMYFY
jgi:hypothetical protein